ncbi:MAG: DNA-directed RNA polymerase alpha subunit [Cognaticolwellia sp.]|jgi:DNA-directed RNA polymerase alpha subunit
MNTKPTKELIEQISKFSDNEVIIDQLKALDDELVGELDYPSESVYWLREARSQLDGMFSLLMDIKKAELVSGFEQEHNEAEPINEVASSGLSTAVCNLLNNANLYTKAEVSKFFGNYFLSINGMGEQRIKEVKAWLSEESHK